MQRSPFKGLINNMANTWLQAAELLGFTVHVSTPSGYEIDAKVADLKGSAHYKVFQDPLEACQGADLVTTDGGPAWATRSKTRHEKRLLPTGVWTRLRTGCMYKRP